MRVLGGGLLAACKAQHPGEAQRSISTGTKALSSGLTATIKPIDFQPAIQLLSDHSQQPTYYTVNYTIEPLLLFVPVFPGHLLVLLTAFGLIP